jgi:cobalt-zinc-cadmium efflux system outer membrane protein
MRYQSLFLSAGLILFLAAPAYAEVTKGITLEEATSQALRFSPKLKSGVEAVGASKGDRRQSSLAPNPELAFEAENMLGTGTKSGFKEAEFTLGIAQPVEMGGKRGARVKAANHQLGIAKLDLQSVALDVVRDTTAAWAEVIGTAEEAKLAEEQRKLAGDVLASVRKRVEAAAEPAIQKSKAEVEVASTKIAVQKAERAHLAALQHFAQVIGLDDLRPAVSTEGFFDLQQLDTTATLEQNPDYKKLEAGIQLASANLALERTNAVPDVTFEVGVRNSRDTDDQSFLAGVSVPFPVFNRNQGAIMRAGHEVTKANHDKLASVNDMQIALVRAQNNLETTYAEAASLKKSVLSSAEKAFRQAREGYQAGKFSYLEVLDAQRTLFDVKAQRIAALKEYHAAKAEYERLTAKHIGLIEVQGEKK